MNTHKLINWGIFFLLSFIWGSSFILMKASSSRLNGWQIGSVRIFAAGMVFLPLAVFHFSQIPLRKMPLILLTSFLGNLIPALLFAIAIDKGNETSMAGILNSLTPLFVLIIGGLFFGKKIEAQKMGGVLTGFMGLLMLTLSRGLSPVNLNTLLILLATLLYGININLISFYLKDISPVKLATVSVSFLIVPASIVMYHQQVFTLALQQADTHWPLAAAGILGVFGTAMATALFYVLINRAGSLFASLVTYGIPVVAIFWGVWNEEKISSLQIGALGLILYGVHLTNKKS